MSDWETGGVTPAGYQMTPIHSTSDTAASAMSETPEEAIAWANELVAESRWIRRQNRHRCPLPTAGGHPGDLWRCGQCRRLWRVIGRDWDSPVFRRAWWWQRIRYIGHLVS